MVTETKGKAAVDLQSLEVKIDVLENLILELIKKVDAGNESLRIFKLNYAQNTMGR